MAIGALSLLASPTTLFSSPQNADRREKTKLFKSKPVNVQRTPAAGPTCLHPLGRHPLWAPPLYAQRIAGWGRAGLFTPHDVAVGRQMIWPPLDSRVGVYSLYLRVFSSRFLSLPSRLSPCQILVQIDAQSGLQVASRGAKSNKEEGFVPDLLIWGLR